MAQYNILNYTIIMPLALNPGSQSTGCLVGIRCRSIVDRRKVRTVLFMLNRMGCPYTPSRREPRVVVKGEVGEPMCTGNDCTGLLVRNLMQVTILGNHVNSDIYPLW